MAGNTDSSGGETWAATTTKFAPVDADPAARESSGGDTPNSGKRSGDGNGKRRPRALTVLAILAVALFAIWGIGGPLFGTSVLSATNEMVTDGPWVNAGLSDGPATNTFLDDTYTSQTPSTILFKEQLGAGNVAEWNPYASGGTPLAALPDYAFFSPLTVPFYVLPTWLAPAYERLLEIICAVGGSFLFLRRLSVSRAAAITGGLVYASSGFMVAWLGFPQTRVAAFIPVLFWALERFLQLRRVRDAAFVTVPVAALILGGFPAVTGYAILTAGAYALVRLISQHRDELRRLTRPILLLIGSVVAGGALTLFQLIPFLGFYKTWLIEGRGQQGTSHLQLASLLTSIAPYAFGSVNPANGTQFVLAPNLVEAVSYIGAAAAVLALVALAMPRQGRALLPRGVWVFFAVATVVWAELIYLGGPPLSFLQNTPVLRALFSINFIGRSRSILGFLLAVLVAVGFELVVRARTERRESMRGRWIWAASVGGVAVVLAGVLIWRGRRDVSSGAANLQEDVGAALHLFRNELVIAAALIVLAVACVALLRYAGTRFEGRLAWRRVRFGAAAVLLVLITAQSTSFVVGYYPHSPKASFYPTTDTHQYLAANLGDQRYASSSTGMEFGTNSGYQLRAVNGHAFINSNFAALVRGIPDDPIYYPTYIDFSPGDSKQATSPVLDRLGTKYFVASPGDEVFGSITAAPVNGTATITPGRPVTVPLPAKGPLRAVAFTPAGTVPASLSAVDKNSTVDVVVHDPSGAQVAKTTRFTAGLATGSRFEVALTAESVPAGTPLTATITLHSTAPLTVDANGTSPAVDAVTDVDDGLRVVHAGSTVIYQRLNALPRIRWASQSDVVTNQDKRVQMLSSGNLPDSTVVLSKPGPAATGKPGQVTVRNDGTDTISTSVNAQGAGYLVVADADQVGWTATVDGAKAALVPADQGLVAVRVPAGQHDVVLSYGLPHAVTATWVSVGVAVLLILLSFGDRWWERRRRSDVQVG